MVHLLCQFDCRLYIRGFVVVLIAFACVFVVYELIDLILCRLLYFATCSQWCRYRVLIEVEDKTVTIHLKYLCE